jgi:multiple antibiotic resistance protein
MSQFAQFLALTFTALFPLINPVGSAIIFLGIIGPLPAPAVHSLARRIAFATTAFLLVIDVAGAAILKLFGVSLPVVQLAGGLVVAAMGWSLLNQQDAKSSSNSDDVAAAESDPARFERKIFYPLTFPITAGPGSLVVTLTLSANSFKGTLPEILFAQLGLILGILLLCASVWICYAYAPAITARISPGTAHGIVRVIAFVVICIGVQIAWNGFISMNAAHPLFKPSF